MAQVKNKHDGEEKTINQILLTYCWGNANAGDKVITKGTILSLRKVYPDAKIVVWHISSKKDSNFDESKAYLQEIDSNIKLVLNPVKSYSDSFHLSFIPMICKNLLNKKSNLYELLRSDLVIFNCGHYFFWDSKLPGKWTKLRASYPLFLAKLFNIPYGIYPHSFGPFEFRLYQLPIKFYYKNLFSDAKFLFTRESLSKEFLKKQIKGNFKVQNLIDSGFFVEERESEEAERILSKYNLEENKFIAMTIRLSKRGSSEKLSSEKYEKYANKLSLIIDKIIDEYQYKVGLVCQVPSDKIHSQNVIKKLDEKKREKCKIIDEKLSPETLEAFYNKSRLLIGMRFHSLIFALNVGTPVMGIYYHHIGPKISGLMEDFRWENLEFDLENLEVENFMNEVNYILNNEMELKIEEKVEKRKKELISKFERES